MSHRRRGLDHDLLGSTLALLDLNDLTAVIHATVRADMMRQFHLAAAGALHEVQRRDEMMTAAIALPVTADSLFRKSAHSTCPFPFLLVMASGRMIDSRFRFQQLVIEQPAQRGQPFVDHHVGRFPLAEE